MGESRQELLAWLNDLLQLNFNKVEQIGTGAALCQIFDSIYGDVQLSRVKFNTQQEYEYVNNFKVLQKAFTDHQIDKVIPVQRLIKCKFQDNLEFLQWAKKFWDTYYPGGSYDPVARRRAGGAKSGSLSKLGSASNTAAPMKSSNPAPVRSNSKNLGVDSSALSELQMQATQLQVTIDGLEKERDFYFSKLRDIEIAVQNRLDGEKEDSPLAQLCKEIQQVLYSVEEGFEVPQENQQPANAMEETY